MEARNRAWGVLASLPIVGGRKRVEELRFGSPERWLNTGASPG